ncbi:nucleoid-associated protein [Methylomonas sp. MS20]|uniref:nucleoid-associated protein n=1 Tax=unclassified Methylomonas TaxID=2608980 RepID=UPI0028A45EA0|nr:nucleoid-associated protein [Methylomonas sp. MV1]MDT4330710.1 nucleoid-associated protein [Methylomonas sp. MV1]MDT4332721.1 nucleoid-associated protein [Methylomonas sp. MV1]
MTINHAIIHQLLKNSGSNEAEIKPANAVLDVTDDLVIKLVNDLSKIYGTKENGAIYGTFSESNVTNQFPQTIKDYLNEENVENFMALSSRCMIELKREAEAKQSSTGGYIVFVQYNRFLLIAMIKDKQGLKVDENLKPISSTSIDLAKIHQAARINLSTYQANTEPREDDEADDEKAYLSFISPRTNQDVSGYFIKALNCTDGVPSSRATKAIFSAVDEYFQANENLKPFRKRARDNLVKYLEKCLEDNKPAHLDEVDHEVRKVVPADHHQALNDFTRVANSEKFQVPITFGVNKTKLKDYVRIRESTSTWELNFDKKAVGIDRNAELFYNKESGTLTIKCPPRLIQAIDKTLSE